MVGDRVIGETLLKIDPPDAMTHGKPWGSTDIAVEEPRPGISWKLLPSNLYVLLSVPITQGVPVAPIPITMADPGTEKNDERMYLKIEWSAATTQAFPFGSTAILLPELTPGT